MFRFEDLPILAMSTIYTFDCSIEKFFVADFGKVIVGNHKGIEHLANNISDFHFTIGLGVDDFAISDYNVIVIESVSTSFLFPLADFKVYNIAIWHCSAKVLQSVVIP